MKKNSLFITCEEALHICDKRQYGEASSWERFKLGLRLCWCKITRLYSTNNTKLTKTMHKAEVNCMKKDELQELEKQFKQELVKHQ